MAKHYRTSSTSRRATRSRKIRKSRSKPNNAPLTRRNIKSRHKHSKTSHPRKPQTYTRHLSRPSSTARRQNALKSHRQSACKQTLADNIAAMMDEYKKGRWVSRSQALAVAYSKTRKECDLA
jgi:hypothetical protein